MFNMFSCVRIIQLTSQNCVFLKLTRGMKFENKIGFKLVVWTWLKVIGNSFTIS